MWQLKLEHSTYTLIQPWLKAGENYVTSHNGI